MAPTGAVIIGAAETEQLGIVPDRSELDLRADAAHRALADAGLSMSDVDGVACVGDSPIEVSQYLGIEPTWFDGTYVGGCSFLVHLRHAAAAISAGLCHTALIVHGESGRSRVAKAGGFLTRSPGSMDAQLQNVHGVTGAPSMFTLPTMRFLHETGNTVEHLAEVVAAQSAWSAENPRAFRKGEVTAEDVLASPTVAYPFTKLACCVVTDGGGAIVVTSRARAEANGMRRPPVHLLGAGEGTDASHVQFMDDVTTARSFRTSARAAFTQAGLRPADIDHVMIYDAFAHVPLYGLEDAGFVGRGESGSFIAEGHTRPGGSLPLNTNGGGLRYTHTGMYGMFAMQEAIRQLRGEAHMQVPDVHTSFVLGVGGFFTAAASLVLSNELP